MLTQGGLNGHFNNNKLLDADEEVLNNELQLEAAILDSNNFSDEKLNNCDNEDDN